MNPAPPIAAFAVVWCTYFATMGAFNPYAPLWFKELGFSTFAIGAIASLQSWTRVVAPYGWGWLGDHTGQRVRLVQGAAALALASTCGLLFVRDYAWVAAFTALLFLVNGAVVPLSEASLAAHLSQGGRIDAARYGRVRVWGSIGFIVAVVAVGALLEGAGIGVFPWVVAGASVLLLAATLRLPAQKEDVSRSAGAPSIASVLRKPAVAWFFASVFFTVLAHTALYAFFSLYLDSLGYSKRTVGALWAVSVAVEIVFFWFQGRWFASADAHRWLQWAALVSVLRFATLASLGHHLAALVLAQMLHALTFAGHHAACIVTITRHFPGPLRGRGQALYSVVGYGLSGVLGGVGGGWLSSAWGFPAVFWAAAVAAVGGLACAHAAARHDAAAAGPGAAG